jgi:Zn-dependent protease with chaperone function
VKFADHDRADLTGNPRSLASALAKLERPNQHQSVIFHLFRFICSMKDYREPRWFQTHPTFYEGIRDLLALEA